MDETIQKQFLTIQNTKYALETSVSPTDTPLKTIKKWTLNHGKMMGEIKDAASLSFWTCWFISNKKRFWNSFLKTNFHGNMHFFKKTHAANLGELHE